MWNSENKEFILKVLRIFFPGHKTWLVKTFVLAGLGIVTRPLWEPITLALLNKYVEITIPDYDWAGWVLIVIGVSLYLFNLWFENVDRIPNKNDVELYSEFLELFAKSDRIRFFKEHDFSGTFHKNQIEQLNEFIEFWDNADHEFVDQGMESARKNLYEAACNLGMVVAKNTTYKGTGPLISVKPDHLHSEPTPDWVKRDAKEINELAPPFVEAHESLVRLGRKSGLVGHNRY